MSVAELLNSAEEKHIQQIVSFAGDGKLAEGSAASKEFCDFLSQVHSHLLVRYSSQCLEGTKFEQSGFALQDIVNEIGRRLSFSVENGRYRGKQGVIGCDGFWKSNDRDIVVEVKTTDTYLINLDQIAKYRNALIEQGSTTTERSSILIVVGRSDTGGLEAQIRGSQHAWDIRLVSIEALVLLMQVKESVENIEINKKIRAVLVPQEFTRVDGIIDLVFSTAEDIKETNIEPSDELQDEGDNSDQRLTNPHSQPVSFNEKCIARIAENLGISLTKQSRATYGTPDEATMVLCAVSKKYDRQKRHLYWFAFHPAQQERLEAAEAAYVAFGCGSERNVLLIPYNNFVAWLPELNQTVDETRFYWHVQITEQDGKWFLLRKRNKSPIELSQYVI